MSRKNLTHCCFHEEEICKTSELVKKQVIKTQFQKVVKNLHTFYNAVNSVLIYLMVAFVYGGEALKRHNKIKNQR